jgi:Flp pilus assembly pilin Flp
VSGDQLVRNEDGASSVEYGLVVTAIAALLAAIVFALGGATLDLFSSSCTQIESRTMTGADC